MSTTLAATTQMSEMAQTIPAGASVTTMTGSPPFHVIKAKLSEKTARRPPRLRPYRSVTQVELQQIAARNPPPPEWFEGEDECPFVIAK